jgi:choline-phosphate cytidylyltransferase/glycerol-3-phosphate cytidylyltransferase
MFKNKTIIDISEIFNMINYDHLQMVNYVRSLADIPVAEITADTPVSSWKTSPIITFNEHLQNIEALKTSDIAMSQHNMSGHTELVGKPNIDAFVTGDGNGKYDYRKDSSEQAFCCFPCGTGVSSSLRQTIYDSYDKYLQKERPAKQGIVKINAKADFSPATAGTKKKITVCYG